GRCARVLSRPPPPSRPATAPAPPAPPRARRRPPPPVRPAGLSPAARRVTAGFWQDGGRLVLLDHEDRPLWEGASDCRAFAGEGKGPGVVVTWCDGADLVTLRPVRED
ncbi:hypothetical protein ACFV0D_11475, partial [Streptomyces sp. NPDC059556]|uniref:hypothetical protein n=1 Tax=Streptomyces sp. NPDC059556 TaxID=3346863 RepID=UPI0036A7B016